MCTYDVHWLCIGVICRACGCNSDWKKKIEFSTDIWHITQSDDVFNWCDHRADLKPKCKNQGLCCGWLLPGELSSQQLVWCYVLDLWLKLCWFHNSVCTVAEVCLHSPKAFSVSLVGRGLGKKLPGTVDPDWPKEYIILCSTIKTGKCFCLFAGGNHSSETDGYWSACRQTVIVSDYHCFGVFFFFCFPLLFHSLIKLTLSQPMSFLAFTVLGKRRMMGRRGEWARRSVVFIHWPESTHHSLMKKGLLWSASSYQ